MKSFYGNNGAFFTASTFLSATLWWIFLAPVAALLPRNRRLVLVYGRDGGKFIDNCKHLFIDFASRKPENLRAVYVARDKELICALSLNDGHAVRFGTLAEFRLWLRAGTIIYDSTDWAHGYRFAASHGARRVQLWHGIPLKIVQIARIHRRRRKWLPLELVFQFYVFVGGRFAKTEWLLSTSSYVSKHAFDQSFYFHHTSLAGYPRNDALFDKNNDFRQINVDKRAMAAVATHRKNNAGGHVAIYAPTFRESLNDPFAAGRVDLNALSAIAIHSNLLLLIKLHPWMHGRLESSELPGLILVTPDSDLYPLLPSTDFLITDYSSIFFDYLLLDRPVLFFPYDLDTYLAEEREMYFDYHEMTPGPKSFDINQLADAISAVTAGTDDWRAQRAKVRNLVFEHQDGKAAERLLDDLFPREA